MQHSGPSFARLGLRITILLLIQLLSSPVAAALRDVSLLCDHAARVASDAEGVPLDVLQAISRTETARPGAAELQPWPWTVNMEGTGRWFESEDEARAYVFAHFKRGARSFDVGCFQINYKWHGQAFRSIDEMFDPVRNARYAARFLMQLFNETGDWSAAAGAYHSRTPTYAKSYAAKFDRIRDAVPGDDPHKPASRDIDLTRTDERAPFIGNGQIALGSLVPVSLSGTGTGSMPGAFIKLK